MVADRGMVAAADPKTLQTEGIEYVTAERLRRSTANEALTRAGRCRYVTRNLEAKEITTEGIERVLVCRNHERAAEDARHDRKWVLRTTTTLPPEQGALTYRGLWRVEHAFRTLKTPLELRPLFHISEAGIRGHVQACVPAYALVRLIEDRLDAANIDLNATEALQQLDNIHHQTIHLGSTHLERTSTPTPEQAAILRAFKAEPAPTTRTS